MSLTLLVDLRGVSWCCVRTSENECVTNSSVCRELLCVCVTCWHSWSCRTSLIHMCVMTYRLCMRVWPTDLPNPKHICHTYMDMYVCVCVCVYVCESVCVRAHIHIHIRNIHTYSPFPYISAKGSISARIFWVWHSEIIWQMALSLTPYKLRPSSDELPSYSNWQVCASMTHDSYCVHVCVSMTHDSYCVHVCVSMTHDSYCVHVCVSMTHDSYCVHVCVSMTHDSYCVHANWWELDTQNCFGNRPIYPERKVVSEEKDACIMKRDPWIQREIIYI